MSSEKGKAARAGRRRRLADEEGSHHGTAAASPSPSPRPPSCLRGPLPPLLPLPLAPALPLPPPRERERLERPRAEGDLHPQVPPQRPPDELGQQQPPGRAQGDGDPGHRRGPFEPGGAGLERAEDAAGLGEARGPPGLTTSGGEGGGSRGKQGSGRARRRCCRRRSRSVSSSSSSCSSCSSSFLGGPRGGGRQRRRQLRLRRGAPGRLVADRADRLEQRDEPEAAVLAVRPVDEDVPDGDREGGGGGEEEEALPAPPRRHSRRPASACAASDRSAASNVASTTTAPQPASLVPAASLSSAAAILGVGLSAKPETVTCPRATRRKKLKTLPAPRCSSTRSSRASGRPSKNRTTTTMPIIFGLFFLSVLLSSLSIFLRVSVRSAPSVSGTREAIQRRACPAPSR